MTNPRAPKGTIRVHCPIENEVWSEPARAQAVGQEVRVVPSFSDFAGLRGMARIVGLWQNTTGLVLDLLVTKERAEGAVREFLCPDPESEEYPTVGLGYILDRGRTSNDTDPPTRIVDAASILHVCPAPVVELSFPEEWKAKPLTLEAPRDYAEQRALLDGSLDNIPPAQEIPAEDRWEVYLSDQDGFVLADPEALLAHVDDPDWIEREYGDCLPESIDVVRRSARPVPQYEGSDQLRFTGGWQTVDKIEFDVSDEEPEKALLLWKAAQGAAQALNAAQVPA